jgi:polysaccharide export outer membrane protein
MIRQPNRLCRHSLLFSIALLLPLVLAGDAQQKNGGKAKEPAASQPDQLYIIKPNDILEVFVWKEPDLTRKVLVRPDGRISFPLVQDLQAAGATPGELKEQIEKKLKEYLNSPSVTVVVDAIQSYRIFVVGKVQKPGSQILEKPITVLQALALAGGFQEYAKDSEITILRDDDKEKAVFNFNYRDVTTGKKLSQNIFLKSGDVVVVP